MNLIGKKPNQVPTNSMLGGMAYQSPENVVVRPTADATPNEFGDMVFTLVSNTSLSIKVRGTDGVVRSAVLTLA